MEVQWALVMFTVVSGAGAWFFAWSIVQALAKRGSLPTDVESAVSFVLLAVGGCLSVLHLKHVDRIFEALNHPTSGIFVEAAMIGIACVLVALYFVLLKRGAGEGVRKGVASAAAVVGIVFSFACGESYMMDARAAWMSYLLPLGYCATAAALGAAVNMVVKARACVSEDVLSFSGVLTAVAGAAALLVSVAYGVQVSSYVGAAGAIFPAAGAAVGCAVAAAAGFWAAKRPSNVLAAGVVAICASAFGAIALRVLMWLIGTPLMNFFLMPLD